MTPPSNPKDSPTHKGGVIVPTPEYTYDLPDPVACALLDAQHALDAAYDRTAADADPLALFHTDPIIPPIMCTFTATLNTVGNGTITATDAVTPSITGTTCPLLSSQLGTRRAAPIPSTSVCSGSGMGVAQVKPKVPKFVTVAIEPPVASAGSLRSCRNRRSRSPFSPPARARC